MLGELEETEKGKFTIADQREQVLTYGTVNVQ